MRSIHFVFIFLWAFTSYANEDLVFSKVFPEFSQLQIEASVQKKSSTKFSELYNEQDRYYLTTSLGPLTRQQFDSLIQHYGSRSQVSFDAERSYELSDFLPPSIQAVINQTFSPIEHSFGESLYNEEYDSLLDSESAIDLWALRKNGLGTQTNCWNTTFENINAILFNSTTYRLFLPGRWTANDEVDANTQMISENEIQLWDILVIREKSFVVPDVAMLMHTAIFLNKNVVFEKTDSTENDPYRLSLAQDVLAKYKEIFGDQLVVEYRRVQKPFLSEMMYSSDPIVLNIIKKFHPQVDTNTIVAGCETGMGGGCDVYLQAVVPTEIIIYKKTGRGILKGPKRVLDRFSPL